MLYINKITSDSTVDFAAEELKKYLRMMMPEGGDIKISYNPEASDGFRLGLMQELGLDVSDADDTDLDDILYIDCDENGGIIAGDNPRSVLLAVYEYLRQNGCRWLMPTVDGEYIPMQDIKPVKYRHKPSMRYRGWCNEGAEYQSNMMDTIDFAPKLGLNVFMLEFRIPTSYYNRYYNHIHNEENRPRESVTEQQILQWKRQCEAEIAKRGLQFHDVGHGWTADPFGIDSSVRYDESDPTKNSRKLTAEQIGRLALVDGKRELVGDTPNYTQCCMGPEENRDLMVKCISDYAENHSNVDYLHIALGDSVNKQCECEVCKQRTPSDWYVILLNQVDEELTRRGLTTRIVFAIYTDTVWPPEVEKLINQDRFTMLFAPISRKYTESLPTKLEKFEVLPYERNKLVMPNTLAGNFAYYNEWRKMFHSTAIAYEYHFWRHQYLDVSGIEIAKRVNEDVKAYKLHGIDGIIEDGSQRSFFPSGLAFYTYARTLFDANLSFEEIAEDYLSHVYGEDWRRFYDYLEKLGGAFGFAYMEGECGADENKTPHYNPEHVKSLERVGSIVEEGRELIKEHYTSPIRVQTVAVRLLEMHAEYALLIVEAFKKKAVGKDEEAKALFEVARIEAGKREIEFEPFYDHTLIFYGFERIVRSKSKSDEPIIALAN